MKYKPNPLLYAADEDFYSSFNLTITMRSPAEDGTVSVRRRGVRHRRPADRAHPFARRGLYYQYDAERPRPYLRRCLYGAACADGYTRHPDRRGEIYALRYGSPALNNRSFASTSSVKDGLNHKVTSSRRAYRAARFLCYKYLSITAIDVYFGYINAQNRAICCAFENVFDFSLTFSYENATIQEVSIHKSKYLMYVLLSKNAS